MDENGMKFDEGEVDELTRALFHDATVVTTVGVANIPGGAPSSSSPGDTPPSQPNPPGGSGSPPNVSGGITFDALKAQLTKHDGLLQNLSISIDRWLVPPKPKKPATFMESIVAKVSSIIYYDFKVYINFKKIAIEIIYKA